MKNGVMNVMSKRNIKRIHGTPLGKDDEGNLYFDADTDKESDSGGKKLGRPKGLTKRTINRYIKVYHQFELLKKKYPSKTKAELYELLATKHYNSMKYSPSTIRNIIEDKRYLLTPSR
jgi:hypothetical protein